MLKFKNIQSLLLCASLLITAPLSVVITRPVPAMAGQCKWWQIFCNEPIPCPSTVQGCPGFKPPAPQPTQPPVSFRVTGVAEECGAAEYQCGNFEADVIVSGKFSNEQREIITEAAKTMSSRMLTRRVLDCTYKYADKDFTGKDNFKYGTDREHLSRMLYAAVLRDGYERAPTADGVGDIYVDYFEKNYKPGQGFTLGQATTGYFSANKEIYETYHKNDPRSYHGRMDLNARVIGNNLPIDNNNAFALAGTMAHELLHNVGWSHPQGYPGTVIKEYGLCISRNGADKESGSSLTPDVLDLIED